MHLSGAPPIECARSPNRPARSARSALPRPRRHCNGSDHAPIGALLRRAAIGHGSGMTAQRAQRPGARPLTHYARPSTARERLACVTHEAGNHSAVQDRLAFGRFYAQVNLDRYLSSHAAGPARPRPATTPVTTPATPHSQTRAARRALTKPIFSFAGRAHN